MIGTVGDVQVAGGVDGGAIGIVELALVAGPPSPVKPAVPFPATVVMVPFETFRMRLLPLSVM